jgi:hypothetical protein
MCPFFNGTPAPLRLSVTRRTNSLIVSVYVPPIKNSNVIATMERGDSSEGGHRDRGLEVRILAAAEGESAPGR